VGVVTQPDRPAGRGRQPQASPVKQAAQALGLEVYQPVSLRKPEVLAQLSAWAPDLIVVAAFGQILPKAVLDLPPKGCLNVHASLLPRWRGASPIQAAIASGDDHSGVTIMLMDEGMDSGDILLQEETDLDATETYGELHDRLAVLGAKLLVKSIEQIFTGEAQRKPQDASGATLAPRLTKETGENQLES